MKKNTIVNFDGKKIKIPFDIYVDPKTAKELDTVENPFTGKKAILPKFATAVYDVIKGSEVLYNSGGFRVEKTINAGREFFQKYFTNEYYTLLD
jgi:hypothetical protein|tara:strand:- start:503 stop:784 length:282 start_codon:yes stop_codon:yes gene_type:complete